MIVMQAIYKFKVISAPDDGNASRDWENGLLLPGCSYRKSSWWEKTLAWMIRHSILLVIRFAVPQWQLKAIEGLYRIWPRIGDEGCSRHDIATAYVCCLRRFPTPLLPRLADLTLRKYPLSARFDKMIRKQIGGESKLLSRHMKLMEYVFNERPLADVANEKEPALVPFFRHHVPAL